METKIRLSKSGLALLSVAACILLGACNSGKPSRTLTLMSYNVGVFSKYEENSTAEVARSFWRRTPRWWP